MKNRLGVAAERPTVGLDRLMSTAHGLRTEAHATFLGLGVRRIPSACANSGLAVLLLSGPVMSKGMSRRAVLRGTGVTVTLPVLESLLPRGAVAEQMNGAKFFVGMIHPNGLPYKGYDGKPYGGNFVGSFVFPANTGALPSALPEGLGELASHGVQGDVMVVGGLAHDGDPAGVGGVHQQHTIGRVLVGKNLDAGDAGKKISSLDVAIHRAIGRNATLSTQRLTLGTASKFGNGQGSGLQESDYEKDSSGKRAFLTSNGESVFGRRGDMQSSGSYADGVSQDATVNPRLVFNRLFCNGNTTCPGGHSITLGGMPGTAVPVEDTAKKHRQSVLHYVNERIRAVKLDPRLGASDRQKLDQYLTGIEDIELRLKSMTPPQAMPGENGRTVMVPSRDLFRGIPSSQNAIGKLMVDLIVKAFEANLMNVASLALGATDGSNINGHGNFDAALWWANAKSAHDHKSSHEDHGAARAIAKAKIGVFAYLVKRLKETDGAGGKLINNTVVYYGSDFGDGHLHEVDNPLVLIASKVPGLGTPGTFFRANGGNVRPVRVMASVAAKFGVTLPQANGQGGVL
jgi:Protein of unknown function (DUF1552)